MAQSPSDSPKPRFRRGIKLGRIVRIKEPIPIYKWRHNPSTGKREKTDKLLRFIERTVGYKDKTTGKVLNESEVSRFKEYKAQQFNERLMRKVKENAPERQKTRDDGVIVDRFTDKPASRDEILLAKAKRLRGKKGSKVSPLLPAHLRKAAKTVAKNTGYDEQWSLERISDWWINYELTELGERFPFSGAGSEYVGTGRPKVEKTVA